MSVNIQTSEGLKKLADKTTKKNIKEALGYTPADESKVNELIEQNSFSGDYNDLENAPNITEDNSGEFQITDTNGNIILRVDSDGISTTSVNTTDGITSEEDNLRIMDSNGNIIFRIDQNGIHSVGLNINNKSLETIIEENTPSGDYNELSNKPEITEDNSNVLQIADKYGNIVAKIDAEGLHALSIFISAEDKNVEELINTKSDINHSHNDLVSDSNEFAIADNSGNMIMKVDQAGVHSTAFYVNGKSISEIGFSGNYDDLTNKPDFNGLSSTVNSLSQSVTSVVDEVDVLDSEVTSLKQTDTNLSNQISSLNTNKSNINHSHNDLVSDSFDFSIADNNGNIIATINEEGLNTVNLKLDGVDFLTQIDRKLETMLDDLHNDIQPIQSELSNTKAEVSGLKTTVNTINSNYFPKGNITYSTTDLTAGSSALTTGKIYIVYE